MEHSLNVLFYRKKKTGNWATAITVLLISSLVLEIILAVSGGKIAQSLLPPDAPNFISSLISRYTNIDKDGFYIIENVRFGIDSAGKNARQTTDGINNAIKWAKEKGYDKVRLSEGTYLIQCKWSSPYRMPDDGILLPSDITFDMGTAVLLLEANAYPNYCIIGIAGKSNVTVMGGTLVGDRNTHDYKTEEKLTSHEWGFGIVVAESADVSIKNVTIKDTTGDGIILEGSYITLAQGGELSARIRVIGCDISNCRRQGISVVGAIDSEIAANEIYDINGMVPQYGIDVEPSMDYTVDRLKIHDNLIYGCAAGAISCHSGSNYEVYSNHCIGNNIVAVEASNVNIYNNTIEKSSIHVYEHTFNVKVYDNKIDSKSWIIIAK